MTANADTSPNRTTSEYDWNTFLEFTLVNEPGCEDIAADRIDVAMQSLNWPAAHLKQLRLALVEAIKNITGARSHLSNPEAPLLIRVLVPEEAEAAGEAERSGNEPLPGQLSGGETQAAGRNQTRGWGFFIIQKQQENPQIAAAESPHIIELVLYRE